MKEWNLREERLFFVEHDNHRCAVMAYSWDDAYRQVRNVFYMAMYGTQIQRTYDDVMERINLDGMLNAVDYRKREWMGQPREPFEIGKPVFRPMDFYPND